jgi:DNA-binding transcriptional LysR family regulator
MLEILAAIREAEARVSDRAETPAGPLRISAPTSFGRLHIAPHLKPFLDAHPAIELDLDLSDGFSDVIGDRLDLAIRIAPAIPPSLIGYRLADSRRVLCAAPSYSVPLNAEALTTHRLLAAKGQMPWRLAGPGGDLTIDRASYVATNSSEVVRELTLAGVGIALRSLWDVSADLASGRLVRVLPELAGSADVGIYAVHARGTVSSATTALLGYLRGLWSPIPPWDS